MAIAIMLPQTGRRQTVRMWVKKGARFPLGKDTLRPAAEVAADSLAVDSAHESD